jgi:hypothetical protein
MISTLPTLFLACLAAQEPAGQERSPSLVVLNEIHYHPADDAESREEFIELHNRTDAEVDLGGWEIRGDVRHRFDRASGPARLAPRGFLVVARDPRALARAAKLDPAMIAGPYSGDLSNRAGSVVLVDPRGVEMDRADYREDGAWPARADGLGSSLERVSTEAPGNLPQNWRVSFRPRTTAPAIVLFETGVAARWFENLDGRDPGFEGEHPWYHPDFDDRRNGWKDGRLAVGYDIHNRRAQRSIRTDATPRMGLHSILTRVVFDAPPVPEGRSPVLWMDWDDGFIAWLNGVEIARRAVRAPAGAPPPWDGRHAGDLVQAGGDEQEESSYQRVWRGEASSFRPGRNVLAFANYNANSRSSDLFLTAKLALEVEALLGDATPGAPSSFTAPRPPPLVTFLGRAPEEPRSSDAVAIRARVEGDGLDAVTLLFDRGAGEERLPMRDDGKPPDDAAADGVHAAAVPPSPDRTVVRFRISARGAGGEGSFPREWNPSTHAGYYVVDERPPENEDLGAFHILWNGPLHCGKGRWLPGCTFVHRGTAWLDVRLKYRGETSCGMPKSGLRVAFNKGDLFRGSDRLNLLGGWQDRAILREKLAWDLFRDIGHPHARAEHAAVYTWGGAFHGLFVALEDPGESYLRRNGLDPGGALWKCRDSLRYEDRLGVGSFEKLTGSDDGSDEEALAELARNLHALEGEAFLEYVLRHIDVEGLIEYQAVKCLISDEDGFSKNWLLHRRPVADTTGGRADRWSVHPWDLDLSFGQTDLSVETIVTDKHPLMGTRDHPREGSTWNLIIESVFGRKTGDHFIRALYGRIWGLLEEKFHPRVLGEKIDRIDAHTIAEARADLARWPRWGLHRADADHHRRVLREYAVERWSYLRDLLLSEGPTTARVAAATPEDGDAPFEERALLFRTFRYEPAPRLRITEIHHRPGASEDLEFIEVRNLEDRAVDISGWDIPAVGYVFPAGSEAPAHSAFVVARDPVKLREAGRATPGLRVFGPYPGRLANEGEDLRLRDSGLAGGKRCYPETIDAVKYRALPPWPALPEKGGRSLELRDPSLDNDIPESWRASAGEGGSPGR